MPLEKVEEPEKRLTRSQSQKLPLDQDSPQPSERQLRARPEQAFTRAPANVNSESHRPRADAKQPEPEGIAAKADDDCSECGGEENAGVENEEELRSKNLNNLHARLF